MCGDVPLAGEPGKDKGRRDSPDSSHGSPATGSSCWHLERLPPSRLGTGDFGQTPVPARPRTGAVLGRVPEHGRSLCRPADAGTGSGWRDSSQWLATRNRFMMREAFSSSWRSSRRRVRNGLRRSIDPLSPKLASREPYAAVLTRDRRDSVMLLARFGFVASIGKAARVRPCATSRIEAVGFAAGTIRRPV